MKQLKILFAFLQNIISNRRLLWNLTKKDLQQKYLGSYLGILWAFIQPVITVLIFWFVFQVGFKSMPVDNFPFILWLVLGMFPWFFFSEAIASAANSVVDNSYLVKKVVFQVDLLPMVKIISAFLVHLFFILLLFLLFFLYGYYPTVYNLQVLYYLLAASCLILGLSWINAALVVFLRDIGHFIAVFLQFLFWGTPIFWSLRMIPPQYTLIIKLNPLYYIIEGYRDSFIYNRWFWEIPNLTCYFWAVTLLMLLAGAWLFNRLRPHFADVL